jgi:hypothetical protein
MRSIVLNRPTYALFVAKTTTLRMIMMNMWDLIIKTVNFVITLLFVVIIYASTCTSTF